MNPVIELLCKHRSVRAFEPDPVPTEHIEAAVRAGQMASTSSAVQAYCVIRATDTALRSAMAELAGGQRYVETAPEFLVFCGDTRRHRLACEAAGTPYHTRLEAFLVAAIDTALFAQNVAAAVESMGYGICFIGALRNNLPRLDALLGLPEGVYPLFGMCVGRPRAGRETSRRPRLPVASVLMEGRYRDDGALMAGMDEYDQTYRRYLQARGNDEAQVAGAWVARMAQLHAQPRRLGLAAYYRSKGASLD